MKLSPWRGRDVVVTDEVGLPILELDRAGYLIE